MPEGLGDFYDDLAERMFGPQLAQEPYAGPQGLNDMARVERGDGRNAVPSQPRPMVSPTDKARIDLFVSGFANLFRELNFTASLPAHVSPAYYSDPIDRSGRLNVAAAVGAYADIVTYVVPPGRSAVINQYGVNVQDVAYTYGGSLLWRIVRSNGAVPDILDFAEQRGSLVQPRSTYIRAQQGDTIRLQVRRAVAAAGAQDVDGCFVGWTWRPRNAYDNPRDSITAY